MSNIRTISEIIIKQLLRRKSNFYIYILTPIIIISALVYFTSSTNMLEINVGIVDQDNTVYSQDLIDYIKDTESFNITTFTLPDLDNKLISRSIDVSLTIPSGYGRSILRGDIDTIDLRTIKGDYTTILLDQYISLYNDNMIAIYNASNGDQVTFNNIYNESNKNTVNINIEHVVLNNMSGSLTITSIGMLIMFTMLACTTTARIIIRDKEQKTYHRIFAASVNIREYFTSHIIVNIMIVFIQTMSVFGLLKIVFGFSFPFISFLITMMCFALVSVSLGLLIVSFSKTHSMVASLSTLIITPSCMLSGCFWPSRFMPKSIQNISYFLPQSWVIKILESLQQGGTLGDNIINILIVLGFALLLFLLAMFNLNLKRKRSGALTQ